MSGLHHRTSYRSSTWIKLTPLKEISINSEHILIFLWSSYAKKMYLKFVTTKISYITHTLSLNLNQLRVYNVCIYTYIDCKRDKIHLSFLLYFLCVEKKAYIHCLSYSNWIDLRYVKRIIRCRDIFRSKKEQNKYLFI